MRTTTVFRALLVSILIALVVTATTSVLSATYLSQVVGAEPRVVTGLEAIQLWIKTAGIAGVLKSHVGWFLAVTAGSFAACLIFLRWETSSAND